MTVTLEETHARAVAAMATAEIALQLAVIKIKGNLLIETLKADGPAILPTISRHGGSLEAQQMAQEFLEAILARAAAIQGTHVADSE